MSRWIGACCLVVATFMTVAASCNNTSSTNSNQVDGHYTGGGAGVQAISFDVSNGGTTVSNLEGTVVVTCAAGSASSNNHFGFTDANTVHAVSRAFSDTYQAATGYTVSVSGSLDGHGAASGTLHWTNGSCDAAASGDSWTASLPGASPPPQQTQAPPSQAACSPQPCGVSGDVTLVVQAVTPLTAINDTIPVDVNVTLTNNATADNAIDSSYDFKLIPSQGNPVTPGRDLNLTDANGNPINCAGFASLPAGQAVTEDVCFLVPQSETSETFSLYWNPQTHVDNGSTITLGPLPTS